MDKSLRSSICEHWPEYLIEAWASSCLMIAVGLFVTAFESPKSLAYTGTTSPGLRTVLLATAVGITLTLLIQSPWGKRSGAHMNPAITVAFLWLRKVHRWDALFYILAQTIGGILGISVVAYLVGSPFTDPPIRYAVTVPGTAGAIVAFIAEILISFVLMSAILAFTASTGLKRFTGIAVGCLVAFLIVIEAPLSGASMNPARSLASAVAGLMWQHLWIYLSGPILGMLVAAEIYNRRRRQNFSGCAKLLHPNNVPCIHCGYCPKNIL
jgi:aquaporin Z